MYDIVSLGELLIDFTPQGLSEKGNFMFEANPGGAPCNVLAQMAKLGLKTAFIGKVGKDTFGLFLKDTIEKIGIDTKGLKLTDDAFTTLAFVTLDKDGNRSFAFSRNNSADVCLTEDEVDENLIKNAKIFHIGTLSLTHPSVKKATVKALKIAKENGVLISVDPNLRLPLWKSEDDAKEAIDLALSYADIIKISDYEIEFLTGEKDVKEGSKILYKKYNPCIMFATCGKDGAYVLKDDTVLHHPCYDCVKTVDTTGAGDSFCGASLKKLVDFNLDFSSLTTKNLEEIIKYASGAASLTTTKYGAISVMPSEDEIISLIK
ncbi:MAG: carbohydrate kinase [Ruminococcaceae bacterium]|nr:carbohydrate kinase [Oscillospiraceae bacterium]